MADRDAAGKLRIYHTIYRLNLSFTNIVEHCAALRKNGVFTAKFTRLYQSYAQELQAEINQDVLETLDGIESHDMFRFGKVRSAREKELATPTTSSFMPKSAGRNLRGKARSTALEARTKTRPVSQGSSAPSQSGSRLARRSDEYRTHKEGLSWESW